MNDYKRFTWLTPFQLRDIYLVSSDLTAETINIERNLANEEQTRRSKDESFVQCPRCKGFHSEKQNTDNLCEKCEQIVHMIKWDKRL